MSSLKQLIRACTVFVLSCLFVLLPFQFSFAQEFDGTPVGPGSGSRIQNVGLFEGVTTSCWTVGTCTVCDILIVMINISNLILRFFAVIALLFFLWGAGFLILSSGNDNMVTKGKGIIKATIIGSIIVLLSWQIVAIVALVLANENVFEDDNRSQNPIATWYTVAGRCQQSQ